MTVRFTQPILAVAAASIVLFMSQPARPSSHIPEPLPERRAEEILRSLPLPPDIPGIAGLQPHFATGRVSYLGLVRREAERQGLPSVVADAVVTIESGYDPNAIGKVGEIGLMQVRPGTAAMLGYKGPPLGLSVPETNVRYGVEYLSQAWRLAGGDLCRALTKYRAGHGEERMTPLSVDYCRRARAYLALVGSPLAAGAVPDRTAAAPSDQGRARVTSGGPIPLPRDPKIAAEERARAAKNQELTRKFMEAMAMIGGPRPSR